MDKMDYLIRCTEDQKDILQAALYGYLNSYREQLEEFQDSEYKEKIEEKIKMTKKMLDALTC
jgi:hypothetical protein